MIAQTKRLMKIVFNFLRKIFKLGRMRHPRDCDALLFVTVVTVCALNFWRLTTWPAPLDLELSKRYVEDKLVEALKMDKGSGCEIPKLDPFNKEVTQYDKVLPPVECGRNGEDWVKCYHARCRVVDKVKKRVKDITCKFRDIIYQSDQEYTIGPITYITADDNYTLIASDHVKVSCTGTNKGGYKVEWAGNTLGFRSTSTPKKPPPGRENTYNVLIFGFDSAARNGFIRRMPKSWKVLTEELGATIMEGYNIVGDGTPAALFPILTGKTELELPDVRKSRRNNGSLDTFPFIFYKLKDDGYRTAYFDDMPQIGTFQYRFNGWRRQPADHYLRAFYLEEQQQQSWFQYLLGTPKLKYCVGDTPQFKLMINITQQFMELKGKWFAFTFIADITHDDFNLIQSADNDTADFLRSFKKYTENTLLIVMGDHGPRFSYNRETLQGKLEERLPLLAILLPSSLTRAWPVGAVTLQANARALTTPHDLHATILDLLGMSQHWNPYRVKGADLKRGLTMLDPIPRNRSCSEAGIELHWCACASWEKVSLAEPIFEKSARALLQYINELITEVGTLCAQRTLTSIDWVLRQTHKKDMLQFDKSKDRHGYTAVFKAETRANFQNLQTKIVVGPGRGVFEASMTYDARRGVFSVHWRDISRVNRYNEEPYCISKTHPHLNPFCYCQ